jgi:transposase
MPNADSEAMQMHIDEIGRAVQPDTHALIILDKAAWHTTRKLKAPDNLTLVPLPPACPELNAAENIWQYLRQTYLANRVFESYAMANLCRLIWYAIAGLFRSPAALQAEVLVLRHHA